MSLTQILLILLVGVLVTKPSDIFIIIKELKKIKAYLANIKSSIIKNNYLVDEALETEQVNFYLKKIINIKGNYHGDYDLTKIKEKYYALVINNDLIENESTTYMTEK